jgi:type I restriction enzyme S subunit
LAKLESGHTPSRYRPDWWGGNVPWLALPDIRDLDGKTAYETSEYTNDQGIANSSARILPMGTICLSRTASVGFVTKMGRPMATSQDFVNWICGPELDPDFLLYLFIAARDYVRAQSSGAVHKTVYVPTVQQFRICCPPLAVQKRIAGILRAQFAAVERARAAAEAQLQAAKALPAAYSRQVFEGPEARGWPRKPIGSVAKVQSGYAFKSEWFARSGVRLLRNANVFQSRVEWDNLVYLPESMRGDFPAFELRAGDIVLTLDRPIVSGGLKVARLRENDVPSLLLQRVGRFRIIGEVAPEYLYAFLNSPSFIRQISGHNQSLGVPHISPKQVELAVLPLPSVTDQGEIVERLGKMGRATAKLISDSRRRLDDLESMPAALLRAAFQGQL